MEEALLCTILLITQTQRFLAGRTGGRVNSLSYFSPHLVVQKGASALPSPRYLRVWVLQEHILDGLDLAKAGRRLGG